MSSKLLLVDDHDDTRKALAKVLVHHGYAVETATSGGEAIKLASQHPFDLAVIEHTLPDGDGCEVMKKLHQEFKMSGIALTSCGYAADREKSLAAGFRSHLTKPVDIVQLRSAIAAGLDPSADQGPDIHA